MGPYFGASSDGTIAKSFHLFPTNAWFRPKYQVHLNWVESPPVKCDTFVPGVTVLLDCISSNNLGHFFTDMLEPSWFAVSDHLEARGMNKSLITFHSDTEALEVLSYFSDNPVHKLSTTFGNGTRCYEQVWRRKFFEFFYFPKNVDVSKQILLDSDGTHSSTFRWLSPCRLETTRSSQLRNGLWFLVPPITSDGTE